MIDDIRNNPLNLSKYDKDKEQLKYEKEIIELLKKRHSIIKFIHPAIIYKNADLIMSIVGNSNRYLRYIPTSIISRYQDLIFNYCLTNPQLLKYVDKKKQLKNEEKVVELATNEPLVYDYLDEKIKKNNKDLFAVVMKKLFKISDEYLVDYYYNLSLRSDNLLHEISPVFFDKELLALLGDSVSNVIYFKDIVKRIENLYRDKYRYKTFKNLLRLYSNNSYIELYLNKLLDVVNLDYLFYKEKDGVYRLDRNIYYHLYKDSLSINEVKHLYYILTNNLLHINNRDDFFNFVDIRKEYLDSKNPSSFKEFKELIYEYKYALNYDEVKYLINRYGNDLDNLLDRYKKYKYNIEEIDEYETLLILNSMVDIQNNYDIDSLLEILEEEKINYKPIKSFDIRINLDDRLRSIYNKEYTELWNKKLSYIKEEELLYEEIVSKNKQLKDYLGEKVRIKYVDTSSVFNLIVRNTEADVDSYVNTYKIINNEYLDINLDGSYYRYSSIDNNKVMNINSCNTTDIEGLNKRVSILVFDKINSNIVKQSIDDNLIIEIINTSELKEHNDNILKALNDKILHYIDKKHEYEWTYSIDKYMPLECIPVLFVHYNSLIISNNDKNYSRDKISKVIINIIKKVDEKKDNVVLINQVLDKITSSLRYLNNNFNKRDIYRELDRMYRKYNLYKKSKCEYLDIITLLNDDLKYVVLDKKYNKNQIEYKNIYKVIDFKFIANNIELLLDNYYFGDIDSIIRRCVIANLIAYINKYSVEEAVLGTMYKEIGKLDNYICGDYSASIFRNIYKKQLDKERIDNICAAIDLQDSRESISFVKTKYKIKNVDNMLLLANIIKDSICLDNYRFKRELVSKEASKLIKIKDTISKIIRDYRLNGLLNKKYISNKEYNEYLVSDVDIEDIWKRL